MKIDRIFTYGEAHIAVKLSLEMVKGNWVGIKLPKHHQRIKREDAFIYYNKKCADLFKALNIVKVKKSVAPLTPEANIELPKANNFKEYEEKFLALLPVIKRRTTVMIAKEARKINLECEKLSRMVA